MQQRAQQQQQHFQNPTGQNFAMSHVPPGFPDSFMNQEGNSLLAHQA